MIVSAATPARPRCPHCVGQEQRLVLHDVPWQEYEMMGRALRDRPRLRLTYDRGTLELMTTSHEHEFYKTWLDRFFQTLAEEHNRPIAPAGSMTFQREDLDRGFESDGCYWVAHEQQRRGRMTWDPALDPPPDLVVEIEISRSCQDRMSVYAAFGVPEVWCFDGAALRVYLLKPDRTYRQEERSPYFPAVPPEGIVPFLQPDQARDFLSSVRAFRAWVREKLAE